MSAFRKEVIICLIVGLLFAGGVALGVTALRQEPSIDPNFVDTGRYVDGNEHSHSFTAEGVAYVSLDLDRCPLVSKSQKEDARYTWLIPRKDYSLSDRLALRDPYDRGNFYPQPNEAGVDLLRDRFGYYFFCPADQYDQALAWYSNLDNYEWYCYTEETDDPYTAYAPEDWVSISHPDPTKLAELRDFLKRVREESGEYIYWHGHRPPPDDWMPDLEPGPFPGTETGLQVLWFPEGATTQSIRLYPFSRDLVTQQKDEAVFFDRFQGQLCWTWINSSAKGSMVIYAPLPEELSAYFSALLPAD